MVVSMIIMGYPVLAMVLPTVPDTTFSGSLILVRCQRDSMEFEGDLAKQEEEQRSLVLKREQIFAQWHMAASGGGGFRWLQLQRFHGEQREQAGS